MKMKIDKEMVWDIIRRQESDVKELERLIKTGYDGQRQLEREKKRLQYWYEKVRKIEV